MNARSFVCTWGGIWNFPAQIKRARYIISKALFILHTNAEDITKHFSGSPFLVASMPLLLLSFVGVPKNPASNDDDDALKFPSLSYKRGDGGVLSTSGPSDIRIQILLNEGWREFVECVRLEIESNEKDKTSLYRSCWAAGGVLWLNERGTLIWEQFFILIRFPMFKRRRELL